MPDSRPLLHSPKLLMLLGVRSVEKPGPVDLLVLFERTEVGHLPQACYRKREVSSRGEAVAEARVGGLIWPPPHKAHKSPRGNVPSRGRRSLSLCATLRDQKTWRSAANRW